MPLTSHQIFKTRINVPSWDFLVGQMAKNLPAMWETQVQSLEDPLEKGMATHANILAWRIPWTEEPEQCILIFTKFPVIHFISC